MSLATKLRGLEKKLDEVGQALGDLALDLAHVKVEVKELSTIITEPEPAVVTTTTTTTVVVQPAEPAPVQTPPAPVAPPVAPITPAPSIEFIQVDGVIGTTWLNSEDVGTEGMTTSTGKTYSEQEAMDLLAVAVPWKAKATDRFRIRLPGTDRWSPWVPRADVGPWSTDDPWLPEGRRPAAEAYKGQTVLWTGTRWTPNGTKLAPKKCNGAGIDLSPGLVAWLKQIPPHQAYSTSWSGLVDVQMQRPSSQPVVVDSEVTKLIAGIAREHVGRPFAYDPATDGGRLGCANVVSHILQEAGVFDHLELAVNGVAAGLVARGWKETSDPYKDGDVVVWSPWEGSGGHKHVGVVVVEDGMIKCVNNKSSTQTVGIEVLAGDARPIEKVLRHP